MTDFSKFISNKNILSEIIVLDYNQVGCQIFPIYKVVTCAYVGKHLKVVIIRWYYLGEWGGHLSFCIEYYEWITSHQNYENLIWNIVQIRLQI